MTGYLEALLRGHSLQVLPEVVKKDDKGFYYINYEGIIPVLVEAIKEQDSILKQQNITIANLQQQINNCCMKGSNQKSSGQTLPDVNSDLIDNSVLYQNNPNPFKESSTINYYLDNKASNATIYIFDMQGTLLKSFDLSNKGKGNIVINGGEFNAGMYMYSLVVNGKEIDTKRMILTK